MKVLVTGASSAFGQLVSAELRAADFGVCGWDRKSRGEEGDASRGWTGDLRGVALDDLFRTEAPNAVVHLALQSPFVGQQVAKRQRYNVTTTRALLDAVARYRVEALVFVAPSLYYGAASDLPLIRLEMDPPLGVATFPEAADIIASDLLACAALTGVPSTRTCVLRLCDVLVNGGDGLLAQLWRGPRVPTVLGFDPLVQFLDARDVATAIRLALEQALKGIYNVSSARPITLTHAIANIGRTNVPIPEAIFRISARGLFHAEFPAGALSLLKYPILLDDTAFRNRTGFLPRFDESACLEDYRKAVDEAGSAPGANQRARDDHS
ncbi:MAG TPA: NAD-dependent epimerase/dehydratase family protein [Polyangiaceae bacterium]